MRILVSIAQMQSFSNPEENVHKSLEFLRHVPGETGLVIFPEYQLYLPDFTSVPPAFQDERIVTLFSDHSAYRFLMVNYPQQSGRARPYNCSSTIYNGKIVSQYRKIHLYDAARSRESNSFEPGTGLSEPYGIGEFFFGNQVCYDIRFPEASRNLRIGGSRAIVYQAGWFSGEGKLEQWRSLLIARAVENGCYVLGSAQCGPQFTGHSMIVSPYGSIVAEAENSETIISGILDSDVLERYDVDYPLLSQRNRLSDIVDH
ncbi:MAG: amidohydrolase [Candidatus Thermoplasmatota archaeon]|nr:amidohydrolase [Candidatus Thermoplasmatota archaeon]MCL5785578.1 amidohydrolase [Candidatus Thermoplasmatota archaeon]